MIIFYDRKEAGKKLAQAIKNSGLQLNTNNSIILALPRGGVIVAKEVAHTLNLPLDIIVVRKIGHPLNPEYAIAAVGSRTFVGGEERVFQDYLKSEIKNQREEIKRRLKVYRGEKKPPDLKNKTIILIDDGLATGLTMKAAIQEAKKEKPKIIVLAVPVAPAETLKELKKEVDKVVCLSTPSPFFAIGNFYTNFEQVTDEEVKKALGQK